MLPLDTKGALSMFQTRRSGRTTLVLAMLLVSTSAAQAVDPESRCLSGRAKAAAKYTSCAQKALAKYSLIDPNFYGVYASEAQRCVTKYAATWARLQANAAATGSTCDAARFTDNGDGTVTDRLTALQWEKKVNLDGSTSVADPHDADNAYAWTESAIAANGSAFTSFLAALNTGGCFAGQCDWRLPTRDELLTIMLTPFCTTPGTCIHPALGETVANYWSATSFALDPQYAWALHPNLADGVMVGLAKQATEGMGVLGVRSGL
jgi:hypothetical protein